MQKLGIFPARPNGANNRRGKKQSQQDGDTDEDEQGVKTLEKEESRKRQESEKPKKTPIYKRRGFIPIVSVLAVLVIAGVLIFWLIERKYVSTDDAYIDGHVTQVSARVSSQVVALHIVDNELVQKGQLVHQDYLVSHLIPAAPAFQEQLQMLSSKLSSLGVDAMDANHRALAMVYGEVQRQAQMLSYLDVFVVLMAGSLIAAAMTAFLKRIDLSKGAAPLIYVPGSSAFSLERFCWAPVAPSAQIAGAGAAAIPARSLEFFKCARRGTKPVRDAGRPGAVTAGLTGAQSHKRMTCSSRSSRHFTSSAL